MLTLNWGSKGVQQFVYNFLVDLQVNFVDVKLGFEGVQQFIYNFLKLGGILDNIFLKLNGKLHLFIYNVAML